MSNTAPKRLLLAALAIVHLAGCPESLPVQDQPCPCGEGYYCDVSAGAPGFCRAGDPQDPCLQPRVIDRFDDESKADWKDIEPETSIVDGRLLAQRMVTSGSGHVSRPIDLAQGSFVVEVDVELKTDSSWSAVSIATATGDAGYTMAISNNAQDLNHTGFFLRRGLDASVSDLTDPKSILLEKSFVPAQGKVYHLRLAGSADGQLEVFLDGERLGTISEAAPPAFSRLHLWGGQNSSAGHGGYFDNLVVRGCPQPVPTIVPDANNPVREGGTVLHVHYDGSTYRVFLRNSGKKAADGKTPLPDTIDIETSTDGLTWGNRVEGALSGLHTESSLYATALTAIKTPEGKYRAYIAANSAPTGCHEFNTTYLAESDDGISWTALGPVFKSGAIGSFDARNAIASSVIHDGTRYHMFYEAMWTSIAERQCEALPVDLRHLTGSGHAISDDGLIWKRTGLAFENGFVGDIDDEGSMRSFVYRDAKGWRALYSTSSSTDSAFNGIHLASSADGLAWTKQGLVLKGVTPSGIAQKGTVTEVFYGCGGALCRGEIK